MSTVTIPTKVIHKIMLATLAGLLFLPAPGFGQASPTPQPKGYSVLTYLQYSDDHILWFENPTNELQAVEATLFNGQVCKATLIAYDQWTNCSLPEDATSVLISYGVRAYIKFRGERIYAVPMDLAKTVEVTNATGIGLINGNTTATVVTLVLTAKHDDWWGSPENFLWEVCISVGPQTVISKLVSEFFAGIPWEYPDAVYKVRIKASRPVGVIVADCAEVCVQR